MGASVSLGVLHRGLLPSVRAAHRTVDYVDATKDRRDVESRMDELRREYEAEKVGGRPVACPSDLAPLRSPHARSRPCR